MNGSQSPSSSKEIFGTCSFYLEKTSDSKEETYRKSTSEIGLDLERTSMSNSITLTSGYFNRFLQSKKEEEDIIVNHQDMKTFFFEIVLEKRSINLFPI